MDYEQFDAEYSRVLNAADQLSTSALGAEIERLRGLAESLTDPGARRDAENDIAALAGVLPAAAMDLAKASPTEIEAERVHSIAIADAGTPDERIARARAGMAEISRLAASAEPAERAGILDLNEPLLMLIQALEPGS